VALFETLEEHEIEAIIEDVPNVSSEACRFVNLGLGIFFAQNIATEMTSALLTASQDNPVKFAREINGIDVLQTFRHIAASFYGMLAPEVLKRWGIRNDNDVREILVKIINMSGQEFGKQLSSKKYYLGKRIIQPIDDLDAIESFDRLLREHGVIGLL